MKIWGIKIKMLLQKGVQTHTIAIWVVKFPKNVFVIDVFFKYYTQSPIIKNGPIRNNAEILGKFKERTLSRSKIRNEQFPSK